MTEAFEDPRWQAISAVSFDPECTAFPFSARLARDNGWSPLFANRVIEEYRRFAYLAVVGGREVTPSDEVDQAWHLHLCYTRHYWGEWKEALGTELHHGPTKGGKTENKRYRDNYDATLALYKDLFGEEAPSDIWPAPQERFDRARHFRRIDMSDTLVLSRSRLAATGTAGAVAAGALALAAAAPVPGAGEGIPKDLVVILGMSILFVLIIAIALRGGKKGGGGGGTGCSGASSGKSSGDGGGDGGSGCGGGCGGCGG
ncbi:glycine-rich domain-containing protein [Parvularcula lutaonensis]|uniref:Glycine-rich domain-containing protein n=1 Tax=Parvularcula lutaonensis TaxID=491923 RepID=A0ABV7MG58_9PROT|nr:hypothetical protein [Parvularcula lutaonensis]GGY53745.1 hypothetical protein GCM10007148_23830 [Parvularcula lutaonensis]